jgi:hypothetical protein
MSQIRTSSLALGMLLSMFLFSLSGCGDTNSQVTFGSDSGQHPATWLPDGHKTAAQTKIEACTECHGGDFSGGISKVACTKCHLGDQETIHPLDWGQLAAIKHKSYVAANGTDRCANAFCHGTKLDGAGGTGPSCSSCHLGGVASVHPLTWAEPDADPSLHDHASYVRQNGTAACGNVVCHGADLKGVQDSGPSCSSCHLGGPTSVHPLPWKADITLHGGYVGGNGTAACRNVNCHGAFLQGVFLSGPACNACHNF